MFNLNNADQWIREVAAKNGIKTGQFFVEASPSHNTDGVFIPGKVRVWNKRKGEIMLTFGTDLNDETVTDQNVWDMTR